MKSTKSPIPIQRIADSILLVRGRQVLLDSDLAALYGVETRVLVQAVKRNHERFPEDFMLAVTTEEFADLKSQGVISSGAGWGGRRSLPFAFTEQGVAMLSSVLSSPRAIKVNIEIMRAFVRLRQILAADIDLSRRLAELERRHEAHVARTDANFRAVVRAIKKLMPPEARG
jgi:hypothetical protein